MIRKTGRRGIDVTGGRARGRPILAALLLFGVAASSAAQDEAEGTLTPSGPPSSPPRRVDAGGACIVDLEQRYDVAGTLSGRLVADYRILVQGPCGEPPGTVEEQWIAHGVFEGAVRGDTVSASFWYTARVRVGGAVEGQMVFGGGIQAKLNVTGRFSDGYLSYTGPLPGGPAQSTTLQPGLGPVELNHVVLAVDRATYDAIVSSDFLATTFAAGGEQTVMGDAPGAARLHRPGLEIRIDTAGSPTRRLRAITFELTRAPERDRDVAFARGCTLSVHTDGTGRLILH